MNQTQIFGNLGADAKESTFQDNIIISLSVAVSRKWNNEAGELQQKTTWFECEYWLKKPLAILQYLVKGQKVIVTGEISAVPWMNQKNEAQCTLKLRVDKLYLAGDAK